MILHHLRNATCVIQSRDTSILVDPMLGPAGTLPAFARHRHRPLPNPLTDLPEKAGGILDLVTHAMVTHSQKWGIGALTHTDHLDGPGMAFLRDKKIPTASPRGDRMFLEKKGIQVAAAPAPWESIEFAGGRVTAVPAAHGRGWIRRLMANGAGFFLELPGEPSLYIAGDTVYTDDVDRALRSLKPDIAVVAAGGASLDMGRPILMSLDEVLRFIQTAPGRVVANHMEALNHCPVARKDLEGAIGKRDLGSKVLIPRDGESLVLDPVF